VMGDSWCGVVERPNILSNSEKVGTNGY
jgi:hypothetical protein